jgi:outer membrane cobalamin receptor
LGETTASFIFNYNREGWNWNLNGFYHDERETGAATLDSYWLLNTTLRYSWDNLSLEGRAQNLADEEYGTISNLAPLLGTGVPNRGTTYSLTLKMSL